MRMPVLFVGHGSPMNAIEENSFTKGWRTMAAGMERPEAIIVISAHWFTDGTRIAAQEPPQMIYDMYGFPEELYRVVYGAPGSEWLRKKMKDCLENVGDTPCVLDPSWGFDHGAWSVLRVMYPDAEIPVVQLSVDRNASPESLYRIGASLKGLREKGVLILGSGNIVHSFQHIRWNMEGGYDWAVDFDKAIRTALESGDHSSIISYRDSFPDYRKAFQTTDHFDPLLIALGATDPGESVAVHNERLIMGSMSMTSYRVG